jgi:uncharacterized OB-fold protein
MSATTSDPTHRPQPHPSEHTSAFWAATAEGTFLIQRCQRCRAAIFYPRVNCTECGSIELVDEPASGQGTVFTYTIARRPTHRAFTESGPYVIAIVELAEGPHVTTNIVECDPDDVRIGMPVEVCFAPAEDGVALPLFRPRAG